MCVTCKVKQQSPSPARWYLSPSASDRRFYLTHRLLSFDLSGDQQEIFHICGWICFGQMRAEWVMCAGMMPWHIIGKETFTCVSVLNATDQACTHLYYKAKQHFIDHTKPIIPSFYPYQHSLHGIQLCAQTKVSFLIKKKVEAVRGEICWIVM